MKKDSMTLSATDLVPVIEEVISTGTSFSLVVTGSSMTPTLKESRDMVRLVSPALRRARRGEIIFFRRQTGEYILHRIRKELPEGRLLINGDAQNWTETIDRDQIIAVVSAICRQGQWISCDSCLYRYYVAIWMRLRPVRPLLFGLHRAYKKIIRRVKG